MVKKAAKIFLFNARNELLLYLRDDKPEISYPNYWDLIGGGIEEGETPLEAVRREIKEEIGIEAKDIEFIGEVTAEKDLLNPTEARVFLYMGKIDADLKDIKLTEGQKLGLFKLDELKSVKIVPKFLEFISNSNIHEMLFK